ncbi:(2Fe-2S)-binding protein [Novosphingobium endophyticum]|uniref:(2Fe-2S)-binding protein n=1 Tax=Novosphingobium endophyticum TaxID=1955250 RepID=A0A916X3U4_9SPHN|nr:aromatic ring-hydroxylating dioxygenase subunit alpha [Novosphingobium endophyticum]GGB94610.1 (2Fe-2S)-binding protein [Novosphingobium endophyticum]
MYPFRDENVFLRNAWYVAAMAQEIADGPLQRTIMDKPVVLYRGESGRMRAMHGLCPHRNYPLGLHGTVEGEAIRCNYHGFVFDGENGKVVDIPSAANTPMRFCQKIYPVVERGPWVWIWPGDPDLADPGKVPTLDQMKMGDGFVTSPMMEPMHANARYMLILENLMDLTHISFLHSMTAGFDEIASASIEIEETEGGMIVTRRMDAAAWGKYHEAVFGEENRFEGKAQSDNEAMTVAPGYFLNTSQTIRSIDGKPVDPRVYGEVWFHHVVTPETKTSFHYFGTQTRNFRLDADALGEGLRHADTRVRAEDIEAVEAIERQLVQFGPPPVELAVRSDTAAGKLRRLMQRALDAEAAMGEPKAEAIA